MAIPYQNTFLVTISSFLDQINGFQAPLNGARLFYRWDVSASRKSAFTVAATLLRHLRVSTDFFFLFSIQHADQFIFQHAKRVFSFLSFFQLLLQP